MFFCIANGTNLQYAWQYSNILPKGEQIKKNILASVQRKVGNEHAFALSYQPANTICTKKYSVGV